MMSWLLNVELVTSNAMRRPGCLPKSMRPFLQSENETVVLSARSVQP